jgi:hypothetical protein
MGGISQENEEVCPGAFLRAPLSLLIYYSFLPKALIMMAISKESCVQQP